MKKVLCKVWDDNKIRKAKEKGEDIYVLEPCPFCGRRPKLIPYEAIFEKAKRWYVACSHSGCNCFTSGYPYPGRAVNAWNKRLTPVELIGWSTGTDQIKSGECDA